MCEAKKSANVEANQSQSVDAHISTSSTPAKEVETVTVEPDKIVVVSVDANVEHHREEKNIKSGSSRIHKLKEKLFRHSGSLGPIATLFLREEHATTECTTGLR
jgi:hypothetical protein